MFSYLDLQNDPLFKKKMLKYDIKNQLKKNEVSLDPYFRMI